MRNSCCLAAIFVLAISIGCSSSKNSPKPSSPTEPSQKPADPFADIPPGCKKECLMDSPFCLKLDKSAFDVYPGEIERLYALVESASSGQDGFFSMGKNGSLNLSPKLFLHDLHMSIQPTSEIRYRRTTSDSFKIEILNQDNQPILKFQDPDFATDFNGPLHSIEFIERDPVFEFGELSCLMFY